MIKHIALFKLKDETNGRGRDDNKAQIVKNVHGLRDNIPGIRLIEVAENFIDLAAPFPAYDLVVFVEFETKTDYDSYFTHPLHKAAAAFASSVSEHVAGITYKDAL